MARQIIVVALVFFAIIGMAYAAPAAKTEAPKAADGPDTIGTTDGSTSDAAPVGGPVAEGVFAEAPAPSPSSGVALQISAILAITAPAVAAFFY